MTAPNLQHRRTHNLLLVSKLLNQREAASPFTLVIDSLEQSAKPLIREYIKRASAAKNEVIFVSFETLRRPRNVNVFIPAWKENFTAVQKQIAGHVGGKTSTQRKVLVIDSLHPLCASADASTNLPGVLSTFFGPNVSLVAVYHADVPSSSATSQAAAYNPQPLTLLKFLATTIFTAHSLSHVVAKKAARERSVAEPVFGLEQGVEGILIGMGGNGNDGLVLEMEYRRKSGRGVREWYFLPRPSTGSGVSRQGGARGVAAVPSLARAKETVTLLEDHPLYRQPVDRGAGVRAAEDEGMDVTFELGLTEKQKRDREGVVLPYFDAQKGDGEGGRILYDMGVEDDFDEEEDEI